MLAAPAHHALQNAAQGFQGAIAHWKPPPDRRLDAQQQTLSWCAVLSGAWPEDWTGRPRGAVQQPAEVREPGPPAALLLFKQHSLDLLAAAAGARIVAADRLLLAF